MSLPAIPLGILVTYAGGHSVGVTMEDSIIGALAGAGVIVAIILLYGALTGREGMGGGDVDEKIREANKNRDQLDAQAREALDLLNKLMV